MSAVDKKNNQSTGKRATGWNSASLWRVALIAVACAAAMRWTQGAYAMILRAYGPEVPVGGRMWDKYRDIMARIQPADPKRPDLGAAPFYSALQVLGLFLEDMNASFDHASDWMPFGRKKLIHTCVSLWNLHDAGNDV